MKKYIWIIVAIVIVIAGVVLYRSGYRVGSFGVGKLGTLEMTIPMNNTDIFVDLSKKMTTTKDNQVVDLSLTPTSHQVIVSHVEYFPWTKKFTVPNGEKISLSPITVTSNVSGEIVTKYDPQYIQIKNQIVNSSVPTKDNPKFSADKKTSVWVEDNIIFVKTATTSPDEIDNMHQVIAPETLVTNVEFYKNRSDVIIFSANDSIFVIETDPDPVKVQNIFPIFKGTAPRFIETDPGYIYVWDDNTLKAVVI